MKIKYVVLPLHCNLYFTKFGMIFECFNISA
jgi:hypothetical protein